MKNRFNEPEILVKNFSIEDVTTVSNPVIGDNQTLVNPFGGIEPIVAG